MSAESCSMWVCWCWKVFCANALLGEISKTLGTVDVFGSIAYVSQISWIQSGTIQDNILYGKAMDRTKYEKAINSCALDKDIETFNHGDLTEIGQRGLNMSGGQKQRIQLARAVYNDANIYVLDDPFSAVDAQTTATLFNVMQDGKVTQSGNYKDLLMTGTTFEQLVNAHRDAITSLEPTGNVNESKEDTDKRYLSKANSDGQLMKGLPGVQLTEEK